METDRPVPFGYSSYEQYQLDYWTDQLERAEKNLAYVQAKVGEYALKATLDNDEGLGDW